ncbi:hypothetical protein [Pseudomonas aeruginosa]|uniref:hypothetical protein n=1 Tax=Pseudomonas aeruginosa TaxID=287 RepID=UPI000AE24DCE|nr:hypothetical protein [Pseudomonas aeruginosa]
MTKLSASDLSEAEIAALCLLKVTSGILVSRVPDRTERDSFGDVTPGIAIYRRLEAKGLCFQTEEEPVHLTDDPDDEPFTFTESIELTEEGAKLAATL